MSSMMFPCNGNSISTSFPTLNAWTKGGGVFNKPHYTSKDEQIKLELERLEQETEGFLEAIRNTRAPEPIGVAPRNEEFEHEEEEEEEEEVMDEGEQEEEEEDLEELQDEFDMDLAEEEGEEEELDEEAGDQHEAFLQLQDGGDTIL